MERICKMFGKARLYGLVGQKIGGAVGKYLLVRNLQDENDGRHLKKSATDHRVLDIEHAVAEPLVVPVSVF